MQWYGGFLRVSELCRLACGPFVMHRIAEEAGTREGSKFYHIGDGWHYHLSRTVEGMKYYKCVFYEKGCDGRALYDPVDGFIHTQEHNQHGVDPHYPDEMALRNRILARCRSLDYTSYRTIMDEESRWFAPEVVARVTYARMRTPMRNARLSRYPAPPADLQDLTRILMDPAFRVITMTDDGTENIYAGSVTDDNGDHHVLFISPRMLERIRGSFTIIHSDGTFQCVPIGPHFACQIFVLVGVWQNHIIYLGWALMSSKTEVAYTAVLSLLRHLIGPDVHFTQVVGDFETAQHNAWQAVFQVLVQGCLWHLVRAYMQEVVELGLLQRMAAIPELRRIIRLTLALPLLPENLIVLGYQLILQHARNEGNYLLRMVRPYLLYVWRYWVSRPWRRARMSCFGSSSRTNNVCESHNRTLSSTVGVHPNVYAFIRELVTLEQRAQNTFVCLQEGRRPNGARKRTSIVNDRRIAQLSEDLLNPPGPIDAAVFHFLRTASHVMDNIVDEALRNRRRPNQA